LNEVTSACHREPANAADLKKSKHVDIKEPIISVVYY